MRTIDAFMILKNEEELVAHALECLRAIADRLGVVSIVDNGSTDKTVEIVESYMGKLPISLQVRSDTPHHGELRTQAIRDLRSPWIIYLDGDETFSSNYAQAVKFVADSDQGLYDVVGFPRYWTINDRYHTSAGAFEPFQIRMFRNVPGVHFPQKIHTEPTYSYGPGRTRATTISSVFIFDHSGCKSEKALLEKGQRYQWAAGEPFINGPDWYVEITRKARAEGVQMFPQKIQDLILWGPTNE